MSSRLGEELVEGLALQRYLLGTNQSPIESRSLGSRTSKGWIRSQAPTQTLFEALERMLVASLLQR